MTMNHNKRKKTKFVRLGNQIVKLFNYKGGIILAITSLIWVFSPYLHVPYLNSDVKGVFGFKWMTSFLFALIVPFSFLCASFYIRDLAQHAPEAKRKFTNILSVILAFNGCFFLLWTFYPMTGDFDWFVYYPILVLLSIVFAIYTKRMYAYFKTTEQKLKETIERFRKIIENSIKFMRDHLQETKDPVKYDKDYINFLKDNDIA